PERHRPRKTTSPLTCLDPIPNPRCNDCAPQHQEKRRMEAPRTRLDAVAEYVHHRLLAFLGAAYVLAAFFPQLALWIPGVRLASVGGQALPHVTLPSLLLAFLLLNAGLGVRPDRLRRLLFRPGVLLAGVAANLALPVLFILGTAGTMSLWHNPE